MIGDPAGKARLLVAVALAAALPASARALADEPDPRTGDHIVDRVRESMGTSIHFTIWTDDETKALAAMEDGFAEMDRLDHLMSPWIPESDVARLNAAAGNGSWIAVSNETLEVLGKAAEASQLSEGAFDITVGSYSGLWKFDAQDKDDTVPDPKEIEARKKLVDWHDVKVDAKHARARLARKGQKVTLGGIAKGYGVDRVSHLFRQRGFADFIVQAGGDMFVAGKRGDRNWRVGIQDPRAAHGTYFAVGEPENRTFSTSGDYERYVLKDGRRYHHIIDPATGYPAQRCRSVTIMAKDAFTAEGLSKIVFIWGPERGIPLLEKLGVDGVVVAADNRVWVTKGLKDKIVLLKPPTDGP